MVTLFQWSPLFAGLAAPLLAWLVVANRSGLRRAALLVSLAAVLAVLVQLVGYYAFLRFVEPQRLLGFVEPQHQFVAADNYNGYLLALMADGLGDTLASVLTVAAWTLLLIAAARAGNRGQLVVLSIVFTLGLAVQSSFGTPFRASNVPPLDVLEHWLPQFGTIGESLVVLVVHVGALAALVCTLLTPMGELRGATGETTATMRPPVLASDAPTLP
jgi:hypothetical protein